jgi:hypothetical protein
MQMGVGDSSGGFFKMLQALFYALGCGEVISYLSERVAPKDWRHMIQNRTYEEYG